MNNNLNLDNKLLNILINNLDKEWYQLLKAEFDKDYFKMLITFLDEEYEKEIIYPPKEKIFNAFNLTPLSKVKVVILGQDPYHNENQACGLSFSVPSTQKVLPPSLVNIFKEISEDTNTPLNSDGDLTYLAKQGVLLLNTVLTVKKSIANSHKNHGWERFTDVVLQIINKIDRPIVYMLWGNQAKSKISLLNNPKHLILSANHPSPLSAYRGFFGCKHFSKTNEFLNNNGVEQIMW